MSDLIAVLFQHQWLIWLSLATDSAAGLYLMWLALQKRRLRIRYTAELLKRIKDREKVWRCSCGQWVSAEFEFHDHLKQVDKPVDVAMTKDGKVVQLFGQPRHVWMRYHRLPNQMLFDKTWAESAVE